MTQGVALGFYVSPLRGFSNSFQLIHTRASLCHRHDSVRKLQNQLRSFH